MKDPVFWVLLGLGVYLGALFVIHHIRSYALYARFARDWERAADRHRAGLKRFGELDARGLPYELERFVEMMRRHDRDNVAFCSAQATYWKNQIPRRLRTRFLNAP